MTGTSPGVGFRLWLRAFAASLLTSALLFAPHLAGEHDFGHWHPEETPEHAHSLGAILGAALELGPPATAAVALAVVYVLEPAHPQDRGVRLPAQQQARAPPQAS